MMEMRLFFEVGAANLICDIGDPAMDYRIAVCEEELRRSQESRRQLPLQYGGI